MKTRERTLVTGAAGFVGRHLLEALTGTTSIVGWHRPGRELANGPDLQWRGIDVTNRDAVVREIAACRPEAIFHLAAAASARTSWSNALPPLQINVMGTHHVLEGVRQAGLTCRVLVVSSAQVYAASDAPLTEDATLRPISPYGLTKLAAEQLALRAYRDDDLDIVIARPFNHIGPGQSPEFAVAHFARQISRAEVGLEPAKLRVGNLATARDITDVRDVVQAYARLMSLGESGRTYNVCSGRAVRIGDLLATLITRSGISFELEEAQERFRPNDVPVIVGDRSRLENEIDWVPSIPMDRTLADILEDWRAKVRVRA
jgi:GDP-4-dehydro-6-deoxy-D-mannose reductase